MKKRFIYKMVDIPKAAFMPTIRTLLDTEGKEGWEVCATEYGRFILKREVQQYPAGKTLSAESFCTTLQANVDNDKLTDKQFREVVENTLDIVQFGIGGG